MHLLSPDQRAFVAERHLATLTTVRADGTPHVVPVGFTWDEASGQVRVTTRVSSVKARNVVRASAAAAGGWASVCQVDGRWWLTLEGPVSLSADPADVAAAVDAYAVRYRPRPYQPDRVVLRIAVARVMGSVR